MRRIPFGVVASILGLLLLASNALAGGGPETTLLVVNAGSPASLRVANEYVKLREIPPNHVLYLEDVPWQPVVDIATFRTKILQPIEAWLEEQGIVEDIDTIAYAPGFPYGVNFDADTKAKEFKLPQAVTRTASLTGMTYFHLGVKAQDPAVYLNLQGNGYFRKPAGMGGGNAARVTGPERRLAEAAQGALRSKDWKRAAESFAKLTGLAPGNAGYWYNLACCLAILGQKDEALQALEKAVENGWRDANHTASDPDLESLREDPGFLRLLEAMREVRGMQPTRGFSARDAWTGGDAPVEDPPADSMQRYRLAVMLGWVDRYGNSVDEVLACLRSAAASDATAPAGTVYLMVNPDKARIGPRRPFYELTIDALKRMGRKAVVLEAGKDGENGVIPVGRDDAIGLVTGKASFQWPKDTPDLLPGAIAEHLTSFGAHFGTAGQTKCTEFLRHGAAGSCGTVAEPYNTPLKFPLPFVHVHYARGCSLAESFYQSVWGPYQLLILGDPLARPFARFSDVSLKAPDAATPWSGTVDVQAEVKPPPGRATRHVELWVDGRRVGTAEPNQPFSWDTRTTGDGVHELRLVAIDAGPIRTRSYHRVDVHVANGTRKVEVTAPEAPFVYGEAVSLEGRADGLEAVGLLRGGQVLAHGEVKRGRFALTVPSRRLGEGTVLLHVRGIAEDGGIVRSRGVAVEIEASRTTKMPEVVSDASVLAGLLATATDAEGVEHRGIVGTLNDGSGRRLRNDLKVLGVPAPKKLLLEGMLRAPEGGQWEFELRSRTPIRLVLAGEEVLRLEEAPIGGRVHVRIGLEPGWHTLVLEAEGDGAASLGMHVSGPRPRTPVAGAWLGWTPAERKDASPPEATVPADGIELHWPKTERHLMGVVLIPSRKKDDPLLTTAWVVETRSGTRGRWKPVKGAQILLCPGPQAPRKDVSPKPLYAYIAFDRVSARQLRVRPSPTGGTQPTPQKVRPLVRQRRRR